MQTGIQIYIFQHLADRSVRIVEQGTVDDILNSPQHPYTRALLSAVPKIEKETGHEVIKLEGDMPSPANPPQGCHFHPRCPHVRDVCRENYPEWSDVNHKHKVRCYLVNS